MVTGQAPSLSSSPFVWWRSFNGLSCSVRIPPLTDFYYLSAVNVFKLMHYFVHPVNCVFLFHTIFCYVQSIQYKYHIQFWKLIHSLSAFVVVACKYFLSRAVISQIPCKADKHLGTNNTCQIYKHHHIQDYLFAGHNSVSRRFRLSEMYRGHNAANFSISLIFDHKIWNFSLQCGNEMVLQWNVRVCIEEWNTNLKSERKSDQYWLGYRLDLF